ncbi:MAG: flagellar biosynthetic protein FliO [Lachnospiraceae bacterium]|nr:flagellar biosynthetic protein FliO [Lachnospiraceae bacterium]
MLAAGMNTVNSTAQLIAVLVIFVLVLALTLLTTKWIARYQKGQWAGGNIEILETCPMGNGKYIQIVRLGDTYIAMAVCKDTVTLLAELPKEQIEMPSEDGKKGLNFKELFQKAKAAYPGDGKTHPKEE